MVLLLVRLPFFEKGLLAVKCHIYCSKRVTVYEDLLSFLWSDPFCLAFFEMWYLVRDTWDKLQILLHREYNVFDLKTHISMLDLHYDKLSTLNSYAPLSKSCSSCRSLLANPNAEEHFKDSYIRIFAFGDRVEYNLSTSELCEDTPIRRFESPGRRVLRPTAYQAWSSAPSPRAAT